MPNDYLIVGCSKCKLGVPLAKYWVTEVEILENTFDIDVFLTEHLYCSAWPDNAFRFYTEADVDFGQGKAKPWRLK